MKRELLPQLFESLMNLTYGLSDGSIYYHYDDMHLAMKTCIFEELDAIIGTFIIQLNAGHTERVTDQELQAIKTGLQQLSTEFCIKEIPAIVDVIDEIITTEAKNS